MTQPVRADARIVSALAGTLLILTSLMLGTIEVLLTPLRWGTVLVPVSVLLAVLGNVVLVGLARHGLGSNRIGLGVLAAWIVPVFVIGLLPRPEGDVIVPGGGGEQWVYFGTLFVGAAAGLAAQMWTSAANP